MHHILIYHKQYNSPVARANRQTSRITTIVVRYYAVYVEGQQLSTKRVANRRRRESEDVGKTRAPIKYSAKQRMEGYYTQR